MSEKTENIFKWILSITLAIIGFFCVLTLSRLDTSISTLAVQQNEIKLELTKIRAEMLTVERVKEVVYSEILKYHSKEIKK